MDNRAQAPPTNEAAFILVICIGLMIAVGAVVMDTVVSEVVSEEWRHDVCADKFGDGAEWVNDSDETFDCRAPNGTEIENVTVVLKGASQ